MTRNIWAGALFVVCTLAGGAAEAADRLDVVVINHVLVKAYLDPIAIGGGISLSCGLIVNTGSAPIAGSEINGAQVTGVLTSGYIPWGPYSFMMGSSSAELDSDLLPDEAVGCVDVENDTLLTMLSPEEVFRNTPALTGWQLWCMVGYPQDYAGTSCYDITMTLGGQEVRFPVQVDIVQVPDGQQGKEILGVLRVSSSSVVSTSLTTWGKLKSLYR